MRLAKQICFICQPSQQIKSCTLHIKIAHDKQLGGETHENQF